MEPNSTHKLSISVIPHANPNIKLIKLSGSLTIHNFFEFQDATRERPSPKLLIVDLTDVTYLDSAALGSFVGLHVSCQGNDRKYALVGSNETLKNLYSVTHVNTFLVIRETVADAELLLG